MFPYKREVERKLIVWVLVFGLVAGFALALVETASADPTNDPGKEPNARASCVAHEAAGVSPPGTSAEAPGGMPDVIAFVSGLPGPTGESISAFAQLHLGTHEACDEAVE